MGPRTEDRRRSRSSVLRPPSLYNFALHAAARGDGDQNLERFLKIAAARPTGVVNSAHVDAHLGARGHRGGRRVQPASAFGGRLDGLPAFDGAAGRVAQRHLHCADREIVVRLDDDRVTGPPAVPRQVDLVHAGGMEEIGHGQAEQGLALGLGRLFVQLLGLRVGHDQLAVQGRLAETFLGRRLRCRGFPVREVRLARDDHFVSGALEDQVTDLAPHLLQDWIQTYFCHGFLLS